MWQAVDFNSHAHVERDLSGVNFSLVDSSISTHTLTWSVTAEILIVDITASISTQTLTWSVTPENKLCAGANKISTHTLTWSVTRDRAPADVSGRFQLTRSRGA